MDATLPAAAIAAFERLHGLAVTLHDLDGSFVRALPADRLRHRHAACAAVKGAGHERACIAFDGPTIHAACLRHPAGFVKACHGGLLELVVPRIEGGTVRWILFAGPWRDDGGEAGARVSARLAVRCAPAPARERMDDLLDAVRGLAARLAEWAHGWAATPVQALGAAQPLPRPEAIADFLARRHGDDVRLDDLAGLLRLSPSRTSHLVTQLFGRPFAALLAAARMESASHLLRFTDLSIVQVALRSGHGDLSHFHAAFRRRFATTPAAYRRAQREA